MRLRPTTALAFACLALLLPTSAGAARLAAPSGFWGVAPQTEVTPKDAEYMGAGGIETIRIAVPWSSIQPNKKGGYNWTSVDSVVAVAANAGLRVLPFLYSTPRWAARKPTTLPVQNAAQRSAWTAFLKAAVERYGPRGTFWTEHAKTVEPNPTGGIQYEPATPKVEAVKKLPIRTWQVWNEVNFFYFAYPVSPPSYAKLLIASSQAIKAADPGAKVLLSGLFGKPTAGGKRGMPAATFLEALYRTPGIKSRFDGVALHPYAVDTETLEELVEGIHEVTVKNHDRVPLYITEMGWGSQNDFQKVAFEQGIQGQVRELRGAYKYLLKNQHRLALKGAYWFSWKDAPGACSFCDSVGLFKAGKKFKPKPAWSAFVGLTGGRLRP
jgi:hypothetical protein